PKKDEQYIFTVRRLDESSMKLKELERTGEDENYLFGNSMGLVYDGPDELYLFGGHDLNNDINSIYRIKVTKDTFEVTTLNKDAPIFADVAIEQGASMQAASLEDGIIFSGRVAQDDESRVIADTFFAPYGSKTFEACDRQISMTPVYSVDVTAYRDMYYALGTTYSETGSHVFAAFPVKTKPQYGDKAVITVSSTEGGRFDREGAIESYTGADEVFTITPDNGYELSAVWIGDSSLTKEKLAEALTQGIRLTNVMPDSTVRAEFTQKNVPADVTVTPVNEVTYIDAGAGIGRISSDGKVLIDTQGRTWNMSSALSVGDIKKGVLAAVKESGKYMITDVKSKNGKVTSADAAFITPYDLNASKITIPRTVKIGGISVRVTEVRKDAFKKCKGLKTLRIRIPKAGDLKMAKKAFRGIGKKCIVKVPAKQLSQYKKALKKAGLSAKVRVMKG
ncbi:MAG: hypothetical protein J5842_07340, partial [Lachnospiraceae bacterium]|nr:hypothetical protein [Lachnospiraceae bacterium]